MRPDSVKLDSVSHLSQSDWTLNYTGLSVKPDSVRLDFVSDLTQTGWTLLHWTLCETGLLSKWTPCQALCQT